MGLWRKWKRTPSRTRMTQTPFSVRVHWMQLSELWALSYMPSTALLERSTEMHSVVYAPLDIMLVSMGSSTIHRVAIVDFDVHHGNGTEEIISSRPIRDQG